MIVIGLTGSPGSGKGTIANHLVNKHGAKQYRFSHALDDILKRIHKPNSRDHQIKIALKLREIFGDDILAYVLKKDILNEKPAIAVIDGMRYPKEFEMFENIPGFKLIGVSTGIKKRYERILSRGEKAGETNMTWEEFNDLEKRETEQHVSKLIEKADAQIKNDESENELTLKIDELIKEWTSK
jgi:dephospho-CoA kinase